MASACDGNTATIRIMSWLLLVVGISLLLLIPTAYAGWIGAPYAPTRQRAIDAAFERLEIGADNVVVDLGAGDGKVLLAATSRGARAVGYELSPLMWFVARLRLVGRSRGRLILGNFFKKKLPKSATHVFIFLMPQHMEKTRAYLTAQQLPELQFVLSYSFPFPDMHPLHVVQTDKAGRVFVYDARDFVQSP